MAARIDTTEIYSFRLKLPARELEELVALPVGKQLGLELTSDGNERLLQTAEGSCLLRFRLIGAEAILTEVILAMDAGGIFFERVLGSLMVRYHGDLHVKLVWNLAERNGEGAGVEVRIQRGVTDYPALIRNVVASPPEHLGGGSARPPPLPTGGGRSAEHDSASTHEREIAELLTRARASWEEYQRLKEKRQKKGGTGEG